MAVETVTITDTAEDVIDFPDLGAQLPGDGTGGPQGIFCGFLDGSLGICNGGLRFLGIDIEQGVVPSNAVLTIHIGDAGTDIAGTPDVTLYGVDVDDASAFSRPGNAVTDVSRTTATATPNPSATGDYVIDVTSIVTEILSRAGWVSGNDIGFAFINNAVSGTHIFIFRDFSQGNEATLEITYEQEGPIPTIWRRQASARLGMRRG